MPRNIQDHGVRDGVRGTGRRRGKIKVSDKVKGRVGGGVRQKNRWCPRASEARLNPFRAPKALSVLTPSNLSPKKGIQP